MYMVMECNISKGLLFLACDPWLLLWIFSPITFSMQNMWSWVSLAFSFVCVWLCGFSIHIYLSVRILAILLRFGRPGPFWSVPFSVFYSNNLSCFLSLPASLDVMPCLVFPSSLLLLWFDGFILFTCYHHSQSQSISILPFPPVKLLLLFTIYSNLSLLW